LIWTLNRLTPVGMLFVSRSTQLASALLQQTAYPRSLTVVHHSKKASVRQSMAGFAQTKVIGANHTFPRTD